MTAAPSTIQERPPHVQPRPPGPATILLFALTTGVLAANLYYVQPLLDEIARDFHHSVTNAGYLVTFTQLGYALGVFLIVPVGDSADRRRLVTVMLSINILGLLTVAASPTYPVFAAASLVVGVTSSATMVVIPYAATLATEATRGRVVGRLMTGLLLGILLARTVSGIGSALVGWRGLYAVAALAVAVLLMLLRRAIPSEGGGRGQPYPQLIASLLEVVRAYPELRRRSLYSMFGLCSFSMLWTALTFLLSGPAYGYAPSTIGLFGLIGAAGATAASVAGQLGDRGYARPMTVGLALLTLAAWAALAWGAHSLAWLVVGIFLLDVGVMGLQVTHQSVIYRLAPEMRSRVTAVFMTGGFVGASAGSALASATYALGGWSALCAVAATPPVLLLVVWVAAARRG